MTWQEKCEGGGLAPPSRFITRPRGKCMKCQRSLTDSINKGGGDNTHTAIYSISKLRFIDPLSMYIRFSMEFCFSVLVLW